MKFKNLLFGLATGILLSGIVYLSNTEIEQKDSNSTSMNQETPAHGARGAAMYLQKLKADPATGMISFEDYANARKALKNLPTSKALNLTWSEMGPSNVGGRTRAILFDVNNPSIMYAGGVSGGLWKSTTAGLSWTQIPLAESVAVVSLAQTPNGDIYVGTGEGLANPSGTNFNSGQYGAGIYKSTDGTNFSLIPATTGWNFVNRLATDGNGKVFAATSSGLKSTSDGGANWNNVKPGNCKDVKIATGSSTVVATINGTVYIADNSTTENFVQQTGLPSSGVSRVEVNIAPTNDNYIYAVLVASTGSLKGVYRTTDKGANWEQIGLGSSPSFNLFGDNNQGWYDAAVLVSPTNPNLIYVGGIGIWKGEFVADGAPFAWTELTSRFEFYSSGSPNPHYVHSDVHGLYNNPADTNSFFVGSDGGIFETQDQGSTFISRNINYAVTQFYAVAPSPNGWAIGGTQDNSTPYVNGKGNNPKEADVLYYGDGGWAALSSLNQEMVFATSQYGNVGRSNDGGDSWQTPTGVDGTTPEFFSQQMINDGVNSSSAFVTPLLLWETRFFPNSIDSVDYIADTTYAVGDTIYGRSLHNDRYPFPVKLTTALSTNDTLRVQDPIQSRFFVGSKNGIYMTKQANSYTKNTPTWYKVANFTGTCWTMSISKDGDVLYYAVGSTLYRLSNLLQAQDSATAQYDALTVATQNTSIKNFSGTITSIAIDPEDNNRVIVTLGGFSTSYKHVWYSSNATSATPTFAAKGGNLPNSLPVYASLIPMNNPNVVIIGTEFGVYATENIMAANPTWSSQNDGINDPVPVFMLRQQINSQPWMKVSVWDNGNPVYQVYPGIYNYGEIYAATHGRGFFKSTQFVGFKDIDGKTNSFKTDVKVYPNPVKNTANVKFTLNSRSDVSIQIYDIQGRFIEQLNFPNSAGTQNLKFNTSNLKKGMYIMKIRAEQQIKTAKFIKQ